MKKKKWFRKDLSSEKWTTVKSTFQVSVATNEKAKRQDQTHYLQYHEKIKLIKGLDPYIYDMTT